MEFPSVLIPLGSLWVTHQALTAAAKFANELRDRVISGRLDGKVMTVPHRNALAFDWLLTMVGTVLAALMFACTILWSATAIQASSPKDAIAVWFPLRVIGGFAFIAALMFLCCGTYDAKVMTQALKIPCTNDGS